MARKKSRRRAPAKRRTKRLSGASTSVKRYARRARKVAGPEINTILGTFAVSIADDMLFGNRTVDAKGNKIIEGGVIPGVARQDMVLKNLTLYAIGRFGKRFFGPLQHIQTPALVLAAYNMGKTIGENVGIKALLNGDSQTYAGDLVQDQHGNLYETLPDGRLLPMSGSDDALSQFAGNDNPMAAFAGGSYV